MSAELQQKLEELPRLDRKDLLGLWLEQFGKPAHPRLRREILVPILAYRLQEKAFGGLKPSTCKRLRRLAEEFTTSPKSSSTSPRMKPGTRIVREWQGQLHEVSVLDSGFESRGRVPEPIRNRPPDYRYALVRPGVLWA